MTNKVKTQEELENEKESAQAYWALEVLMKRCKYAERNVELLIIQNTRLEQENDQLKNDSPPKFVFNMN